MERAFDERHVAEQLTELGQGGTALGADLAHGQQDDRKVRPGRLALHAGRQRPQSSAGKPESRNTMIATCASRPCGASTRARSECGPGRLIYPYPATASAR